MKRNIVIAAVTAAALIGGGTATALATTDDDDSGTTTRQTDVRGASDDDTGDDANDRADDDADDRDDDGARASSAKVTAADAIAAALEKTPGTAVSAELDDEDRDDDDGDDDERAAWEVDILAGDGTWHSVWIDPVGGKVLGSETDDEDDTDEVRAALKGTSVDAAEAARAAAGHGTVTSVELDDDGYYGDGEVAWEAETHSSGDDEKDWRVDPKTGKVTADRSHHSDSDDSDDSDDSGPDDD